MSIVDDALEVWGEQSTYVATLTLTSLKTELKNYAVEAVRVAQELIRRPPVQAGSMTDAETLSVVVHMANSGAVPLRTVTDAGALAEQVRLSLVGIFPTERNAAAEAVRMVGGAAAVRLFPREEAALGDTRSEVPPELIRRAEDACIRIRPGATWREVAGLGWIVFMLY